MLLWLHNVNHTHTHTPRHTHTKVTKAPGR